MHGVTRRNIFKGASIAAFSLPFMRLTNASPWDNETMTWGRVNRRLFRRRLYALRDLKPGELPYHVQTMTPLERDVNYLDENGVTRVLLHGEFHYNPVTLSQYSLAQLNNFRLTDDARYFDAAEANVDHLISMAVSARGALYLPYDYDFDLHQWKKYFMRATWWSGMAQGQALSATLRMWEHTREKKYLDFARGLYASFLNWPVADGPWTVSIGSDDDCYWIEEYPRNDGSCLALNGHNFGVYGLYDFWRITKSTQAMYLIQGAMTAATTRIKSYLRNPGRPSYYCNHLDFRATRYHKIHIDQLYKFHGMTGAGGLALTGDTLLSDFPTSFNANRAIVRSGDYQAKRFDIYSGEVLSAKTITVPEDETHPVGGVARRRSMRGQEGVWLELAAGALAGYWVREDAKTAYVRYFVDRHRFDYPRRIEFEKGTYTGYRLAEPRGEITSRSTYSLPRMSAAACDQRAIVDGQQYFHVTNGMWTDRWIPAQSGVKVL